MDNLEDEIDPIAWVGRRPGSTFWYRAYGDCLANIGILDAERIAFDRSSKKRFERVMVFVVDGAFTAKCSIKEHLRGAPVYDTTRHLKFLSRGAAHGVYAATVTEITI